MSKEEDILSDPILAAQVKDITGFTPSELVNGLLNQIKNAPPEERFRIAARTPSLAGVIYDMFEAEKHRKVVAEKKPPITPIPSPEFMQGDTRGFGQRRGLHSSTMREIIQKANQRDPTAPYFDPNSDHMAQINPLTPHWNLSGDFPILVTPLKPGFKMSGPA